MVPSASERLTGTAHVRELGEILVPRKVTPPSSLSLSIISSSALYAFSSPLFSNSINPPIITPKYVTSVPFFNVHLVPLPVSVRISALSVTLKALLCGCPNITALHERSLSDYVEHKRSGVTAITRTSPDVSSYFLLLPESRACTARVSTRVNISAASGSGSSGGGGGGGGASQKQRKATAQHMTHLGALHYRTMAAFDRSAANASRRRSRQLRMLHWRYAMESS